MQQTNDVLEYDAWGDLDVADLGNADQTERERILEICRAYQGAFASPQGQYVLTDLVETFIVRPRIAEPGDDLIQVGIRQGQADIVRRILNFIEVARTGGQ